MSLVPCIKKKEGKKEKKRKRKKKKKEESLKAFLLSNLISYTTSQ